MLVAGGEKKKNRGWDLLFVGDPEEEGCCLCRTCARPERPNIGTTGAFWKEPDACEQARVVL